MTLKEWKDLLARAETDAEAQWDVGAWLYDGATAPDGSVVVRRDPRAAVRWFRKSAAAGNARGQNHLGLCLSNGDGVRRHVAEALRWYRRAARGGEICAVMNLGREYRDLGNHRRAIFWHRRAVSQGEGDALVEVGRAYYKGLGVKRDPKRAVRYFRMAIRHGNIFELGREDAMYCLALALHQGSGVRKSDSLALKWALRANVDDDHADARGLIKKLRAGRER